MCVPLLLLLNNNNNNNNNKNTNTNTNTSWNYTDAEDLRNERLLDKRWRAWRRDFEAQVRRHTYSSSHSRNPPPTLQPKCYKPTIHRL